MAKRSRDSAVVVDGAGSSHGDRATAVQSRLALRVEHPAEGAMIAPTSYTFQIAAAPSISCVDIAVDGGDWKPCREALGLWWCDWSGFEKGEHTMVARTRKSDGLSTNSAPRQFSVV